MPLAETEPTAKVVTSKASSKTWRDNAKTEGHYKRKKREENVVIAFRKRFLWHALDPAVRKAKEPRIGAKEPKLPSSTGDISFDEGEWASLEARAKSSANARIAVIKREIAKERLSEMSDGSQADDIEVQSLGDDPNDDPIETDKRKSEVFDELETRPFVHANANDDLSRSWFKDARACHDVPRELHLRVALLEDRANVEPRIPMVRARARASGAVHR